MRCVFCNSDIDDVAAVCPACQRDVAVPPALLKERDDLVKKRERLTWKLSDAKATLASRTLSKRSHR